MSEKSWYLGQFLWTENVDFQILTNDTTVCNNSLTNQGNNSLANQGVNKLLIWLLYRYRYYDRQGVLGVLIK